VTCDPLAFRFRLDDPALYGLRADSSGAADFAFTHGLSQNVRVTEKVLPALFRAARTVEERLGITQDLTVFVYASPEINAYVSSDTAKNRILVFVSSSLLTALTQDEWLVVLGHEIGHHIFGHHLYPPVRRPEPNLRVQELKRAAEISADRTGLIACGDIDTTLRAMLKVSSGLDERLLDIDITDYMKQLSELREMDGAEWVFYSTHPPFPVRVRALLRCDSLLRDVQAGGDPSVTLASLDADVARDLKACTSGRNGRRFEEEAISAAFWHAARAACRDGSFTAGEQAALASEFGGDRVQGLKRLLSSAASKEEAMQLLEERAHRARMEVEHAPLMADEKFREILDRLSRAGLEI
jgi:hypothetical protein